MTRRPGGIRFAAVAPLAAALLAAALIGGCAKHPSAPPALAPRTYYMGFSGVPPKPDLGVALQAIAMWSTRADAALVLNEPPWDSLLAGTRADSLVMRQQLPAALYLRALGMRIVASLDPTNGLDRSSDSAPLVAAGRSLTEPAIRQLYRNYAVALDTLLHPDYLSLGSETNLVRAAAPAPLYAAVVQNAAEAAAAVRAVDPAVKLYTTVQVEVAWGRLASASGYQGIAQDRSDFPFDQALGLSSYPYLGGFSDPDSLPADYYTRLVLGDPLPLLVIEGGWTSHDVGAIHSTPDVQRRYIARQAGLLDAAAAVCWFQITFTDLDLNVYPAGVAPFAWLGLVDVNLTAKPALAAWDAEFARPRH